MENGNFKTLGIVVTIIALISGIAAIVRPMQQSIDGLHDRIDRLQNDLEKARTSPTTETASRLAEVGKQFAEVETQFRWLRETFTIEIAGHQRRIDVVETRLSTWQLEAIPIHSSHEERIKELERVVKK